MNLSQDIVYKELTYKLPFEFLFRKNGQLLSGRPRCFTQDQDGENLTLIVSAEQLPLVLTEQHRIRNSLIICTEPCTKLPKISPSHQRKNDGNSVIIAQKQLDTITVFNTLQQIYDTFEAWETSLMRFSYASGDFQDLIDATTAILNDPICVLDKEFRHIAYCNKSIEKGLVEAFVAKDNRITHEAFNEIITDSRFSTYYGLHHPFTSSVAHADCVCQNIFYRQEFVGRILIQCSLSDQELVRSYFAIMEMLSPYADAMYLKSKSFGQSLNPFNSIRRLVEVALSGERVPESSWKSALADNEWLPGQRLQLLQFRQNLRYDKNSYSQFTSTEIEELWEGCLSLEHNNMLVLLVNRDKFSAPQGTDFNQALSYYLRDNLLCAGISKYFSSADQILQAFQQTEDALEIGMLKNPTHWYHKFEDYVLDYLFSCCINEYGTEQISSPKLLKLREHDEAKGTEYYQTLLTYFSCSFNAVRAAEKLYIHRSTFINRMNKIKEIADINYESLDDLTYTYLSFKLLEDSEQIT